MVQVRADVYSAGPIDLLGEKMLRVLVRETVGEIDGWADDFD